jgi:UDP-N-acetylglucosamine--N-acetylmuramyl-(pentapeptide) pyrophosphoryl-undecaprenol N-acetylglucosamine transferase
LAELRILIAGGGTGGHIIPALAVAHDLVERHGAEVLFVGTQRGMEIRLVPDAGFKLRLIDVGRSTTCRSPPASAPSSIFPAASWPAAA